MRRRPHLFKELAQLVTERRLVLLLGSEKSYLSDFVEGFQDYIQTCECESCEGLTHIRAYLQPEHFQSIYESSNLLPPQFRIIDCLFASLAFAAANGLKESMGKFVPPVFTPEMVGNPVDFARPYLSKAPLHSDYHECVNDFMNFLNNAAQVSGLNGKITIFLPFYAVEEVINGDERCAAETMGSNWRTSGFAQKSANQLSRVRRGNSAARLSVRPLASTVYQARRPENATSITSRT